jgi:multidrug efflux pump subunit AcrA (membrane-fusion protein)
MTALAFVQFEARDNVLRLPLTAIKSRSDGWYVTRRDPGGILVEVPIQIGWRDETGVEIREGLSEGDAVVIQP